MKRCAPLCRELVARTLPRPAGNMLDMTADVPAPAVVIDIIDDRSPADGVPIPRRVVIDGRDIPLPRGAKVDVGLPAFGEGGVEVTIRLQARRVRTGYADELHTRLDEYYNGGGTIVEIGNSSP